MADVVDEFDVFISHAWEDKEEFVRPLAGALMERGLNVWFDETSLDIGDSLRQSIDMGLGRSRFGVVVLSPSFFSKDWPAWELNGLIQKAMGEGRKVVLPVWHRVSRDDVAEYSYPLADLIAASSADGVEAVADSIVRVVTGSASASAAAAEVREKSEQRLIASAKRLIADPAQAVAVNDLADAVGRDAFAALSERYSDNIANASSLDVPKVLAEYRRSSRSVTRLCALGANLGHEAHEDSWQRAVAIVARDPGAGQERRLSEAVWQYPLALLVYATGVAALQRGRLGFVSRMLLRIQMDRGEGRDMTPLVQGIRWEKLGPFVKDAHETKWKTPLSEDLFMALPDLVLEFFIDEAEMERTFDLFEYALSLAHLSSEGDKQYRWVPPARYMWKGHFDEARLDKLADRLAVLGAVDAFFGGNEEAFSEAKDLIRKAASNPSYF